MCQFFTIGAEMEISCASLFYDYPEALVPTEPTDDFRTLLYDQGHIGEINKTQILDLFRNGDLLVLNNTKVDKRRVYTKNGLEILFVKALDSLTWEVLLPVKKMKAGEDSLPGDVQFELVQKGLPQILETSRPLNEDYFLQFGELALPPYIQKARNQRHNTNLEEKWYQTEWASQAGSAAAPTASLHFKKQDLEILQDKGVQIEYLTLHVGLGTFLPIKSEKLSEHKMHAEYTAVPLRLKQKLEETKSRGNKVWALGTTVTRSLESLYTGHLQKIEDSYVGETNLFITPGFDYRAVDVLMTNFHQPGSTLLALVAAFAGLGEVLRAYRWAVDQKFRLFSYGDLSLWIK